MAIDKSAVLPVFPLEFVLEGRPQRGMEGG